MLATKDLDGPNPFDGLSAVTRQMHMGQSCEVDLPFRAGWVGYLAYEAGQFLERLPAGPVQDIDLPLARFGLYGSAAVYDHLRQQWYVTGTDLPGSGEPGLLGQKGMRFWRDLLCEAERVDLYEGTVGAVAKRDLCEQESQAAGVDEFLRAMRASLSDRQFEAAVARVVEYIAAGDVYQVNLARRLSMDLPADPLALYLRLCQTNPAWYAAYLDLGDTAVLSSSPELFLQLADGHVVTRPIKGTRARVGDSAADVRARDELCVSEKDRAELVMIVDLQRNDLGRVCAAGSVRVIEPFALEEHPTVYHLTSTIQGQLRESCDAIDLLRATFPGGSITGAPKIRAMEIIADLEPVARGVYCGAIGYIGLDGRMTMNIAIRTMVVDGKQVHLYAGGGIVADSQPAMELNETVAKARGMARALMG